MTARAQAIWSEAFQIGYRYGFTDGHDASERAHWSLPTYGEAVDAIIDIGCHGIERRRREAGR